MAAQRGFYSVNSYSSDWCASEIPQAIVKVKKRSMFLCSADRGGRQTGSLDVASLPIP